MNTPIDPKAINEVMEKISELGFIAIYSEAENPELEDDSILIVGTPFYIQLSIRGHLILVEEKKTEDGRPVFVFHPSTDPLTIIPQLEQALASDSNE